MNTELILLIISLFSNAVIILKKIRVIWTPCLIISCTNEVEEETNSTETTTPNRLKQFLNKLTPRKQQQTARVATLGSEPRQN